MRLSIAAAGIISSTTSDVASAKIAESGLGHQHHQRRRKLKRKNNLKRFSVLPDTLLLNVFNKDDDLTEKEEMHRHNHSTLFSSWKKMEAQHHHDIAAIEKKLTNNSKKTSTQECNPNSFDANIGILSCGTGQYCMESTSPEDGSNELGGICVDVEDATSASPVDDEDHRNLYSDYLIYTSHYLCNADHPNFGKYYNCNCSDFDDKTGLGIIDCISVDYFCDWEQKKCARKGYILISYGLDIYQYTYCYDFVAPYEQKVCYTYHSNYIHECEVTFNGKVCNSCELIPAEFNEVGQAIWGGYDEVCLNFDCENTCGKHSGNRCSGEYPILILDDSRAATGCGDEVTALSITNVQTTPTTPNQSSESDEAETTNTEGNDLDDGNISSPPEPEIEEIKDVRAHVDDEADKEEEEKGTDKKISTTELPSSDDSGVGSKIFTPEKGLSTSLIGLLSLGALLYSLA